MSLRRSTTTLFACAGLALTSQGDAQARIRPTPVGMDRE